MLDDLTDRQFVDRVRDEYLATAERAGHPGWARVPADVLERLLGIAAGWATLVDAGTAQTELAELLPARVERAAARRTGVIVGLDPADALTAADASHVRQHCREQFGPDVTVVFVAGARSVAFDYDVSLGAEPEPPRCRMPARIVGRALLPAECHRLAECAAAGACQGWPLDVGVFVDPDREVRAS